MLQSPVIFLVKWQSLRNGPAVLGNSRPLFTYNFLLIGRFLEYSPKYYGWDHKLESRAGLFEREMCFMSKLTSAEYLLRKLDSVLLSSFSTNNLCLVHKHRHLLSTEMPFSVIYGEICLSYLLSFIRIVFRYH